LKVKFADFCAGIGGFRLGLKWLDWECTYSCEVDERCENTYEINYGDKFDFHDITKIKPNVIAKYDVFCAGFPCQPFSISGVSKKNALKTPHGFKDPTQGTLFFEIKRILESKKPKAFLLENVKNLKSHDKGRTYKIILDILKYDLNYDVYDEVIDARSYVPQHRERIYIAGFRDKVKFSFPVKEITAIPKFRDILEKKVSDKYTLTDHLWSYLQSYALKHREKGNGFGFGLTSLDGYSRTLSARYYKDGSEILIPQRGKNPRRLTPRECANLMGFTQLYPDYKIPVSDTQAYKQFGNSVVVPLVFDIAVKIVETVNSNSFKT